MPAQLNFYPVKHEVHFTGTRYTGLTGGEIQPGSRQGLSASGMGSFPSRASKRLQPDIPGVKGRDKGIKSAFDS
jgi:hypothetical protein